MEYSIFDNTFDEVSDQQTEVHRRRIQNAQAVSGCPFGLVEYDIRAFRAVASFHGVPNLNNIGSMGVVARYDRVEVMFVGVDENYQRQGVGRSLLRAAEELGRMRNCSAAITWVPKNDAMAGFLKACGYEQALELKNAPANHRACLFTKTLVNG